jgi:hypothetical protein
MAHSVTLLKKGTEKGVKRTQKKGDCENKLGSFDREFNSTLPQPNMSEVDFQFFFLSKSEGLKWQGENRPVPNRRPGAQPPTPDASSTSDVYASVCA